MRVRYFSILILGIILLSCENFINWETERRFDPRLVVQAILTDEFTKQEVLLSRTTTNPNADPGIVADAKVWVEYKGRQFAFEPDSNQLGRYLSQVPFAVEDSQDCQLNIEWGAEIYRANSKLSKVLPMDAIVFDTVPRQKDLFSLNSIGEIFDISQNAMYEIDIDRSQVVDSGQIHSLVYFYAFNSIHINELIRARREEVIFPKGSRIIVTKYGLNDEFAFFLKSMLLETEWNGNFYFSQAANLPTNVEPDALGFFTTCAVIKDTLKP